MFSINCRYKYQYYRLNAYIVCAGGILSTTSGVEERYKIRDVNLVAGFIYFLH